MNEQKQEDIQGIKDELVDPYFEEPGKTAPVRKVSKPVKNSSSMFGPLVGFMSSLSSFSSSILSNLCVGFLIILGILYYMGYLTDNQ